MAIIQANTSNFAAKLATLKSGDTLQLAAGNYGDLNLAKKVFTGAGITIKGGTFSSVYFSNSQGITLDGATVQFKPDQTTTSNSQAVRFFGSSNITITNSKVVGGLAVNGVDPSATKLDATGNVIGLPAGKAINIDSTSKNITISNSDISLFAKGVVTAGSNVTITGNAIHDLRTTPIDGTATTGLVISNNHLWNSTPWNYGGDGDHGDRIHIWTTSATVKGLVITNNVMEQGTGAPMLGIYLDDNGKGLGFQGVTITGNKLMDGHASGILLENVSGTITDNVLTWSGSGNAYNNTPRIRIDAASHDLSLNHNTAEVYVYAGARNVSITNEIGAVTYQKGISAGDLANIHVDANHYAVIAPVKATTAVVATASVSKAAPVLDTASQSIDLSKLLGTSSSDAVLASKVSAAAFTTPSADLSALAHVVHTSTAPTIVIPHL